MPVPAPLTTDVAVSCPPTNDLPNDPVTTISGSVVLAEITVAATVEPVDTAGVGILLDALITVGVIATLTDVVGAGILADTLTTPGVIIASA